MFKIDFLSTATYDESVTKRQREDAAKYLYDLSKIVFALAVVGNLLSEHFKPSPFLLGLAAALVFFVAAYILDKED